jgi:hypothetical protein
LGALKNEIDTVYRQKNNQSFTQKKKYISGWIIFIQDERHGLLIFFRIIFIISFALQSFIDDIHFKGIKDYTENFRRAKLLDKLFNLFASGTSPPDHQHNLVNMLGQHRGLGSCLDCGGLSRITKRS